MSSKIITYTAITNGKDKHRTDVVSLSGYDRFQNPVLNAKIYKVLAHKFLDCDISVWVDGNIRLLQPVGDLVQEWLGDNDMALFRHYKRMNLDGEMKLLRYKFSSHSPIYQEALRQANYYRDTVGGFSRHEMVMGGVLIRRHTEAVARFNETWWAEICYWGQRDQLSLPMALRQSPDLKVHRIDGNIKRHPYLVYEDHSHYLT